MDIKLSKEDIKNDALRFLTLAKMRAQAEYERTDNEKGLYANAHLKMVELECLFDTLKPLKINEILKGLDEILLIVRESGGNRTPIMEDLSRCETYIEFIR